MKYFEGYSWENNSVMSSLNLLTTNFSAKYSNLSTQVPRRIVLFKIWVPEVDFLN